MKIDDILKPGTSEHYLISNADGKQWLIDSSRVAVSLMLYQPSGWRGVTLKRLLPSLHWLRPVRDALHISTVYCRLTDSLSAILPAGIDFAVFSGTPCVHQKLTMQYSLGDRILGYAKVTDSAEIAALFDDETRLLRYLADKGVRGIPDALYLGEYEPGRWTFVQSTAKTLRSSQVRGWSALTEDFLKRLNACTSVTVRFDDSDFCRSVIALKEHLHWLPDDSCRRTVSASIDNLLSDMSGKKVTYSAYHGDFTPWNMLITDGSLFVFDWEYGALSYPPGLDRYHFYTQTALYERHLQAEEIIEDINTQAWINPRQYSLYLLDIISRFTMREKGNPDRNILSNLFIWNEILKYLTTWTR